MEAGNTPIDMRRLTKPEEDAFRHIAEALGARFAGDDPDPGRGRATSAADAGRPAWPLKDVRATSPRIEPFRIRPATAQIAEADDGTADRTIPGRTTIAAQNTDETWIGSPGQTGGGRQTGGDGLIGEFSEIGRTGDGGHLSHVSQGGQVAQILDRVPVALVIVVEDELLFLNRAAKALFGYPSIDELNDAGGIGALFDESDSSEPKVLKMVSAAGAHFLATVTLSTVQWGPDRAVLFTVVPAVGLALPDGPAPGPQFTRRTAAAAIANDPWRRGTGLRSRSPLYCAVRDVRRLVHGSAILLISATDHAQIASDRAEHDAHTRLLRLLLLSVAAHTPAGTVIAVRDDGADTVRLWPWHCGPRPFLTAICSSERIIAIAGAAHRRVIPDPEGGLTITPTNRAP